MIRPFRTDSRIPPALRAAALAALAVVLAGAAGVGISPPGNFDTVAPRAGTAAPPSESTGLRITIPFTGAFDVSGLARVELWVRTDSEPWAPTGLVLATPSGTFHFTPVQGSGTYYFDLVAQDALGNRSAAPTGLDGTGDGATNHTAVAGFTGWMLTP
jgi:hypothetical protein